MHNFNNRRNHHYSYDGNNIDNSSCYNHQCRHTCCTWNLRQHESYRVQNKCVLESHHRRVSRTLSFRTTLSMVQSWKMQLWFDFIWLPYRMCTTILPTRSAHNPSLWNQISCPDRNSLHRERLRSGHLFELIFWNHNLELFFVSLVDCSL